MNTRNYSQKTNYMCGSDALNLLPFYVMNTVLPGITLSSPEIGGRSGAKIKLQADNITFNQLNFEVIVDEDYLIHKEFTDIVFKHLNLESGTYADFDFDFWMEMTDNMGKKVLKVDFFNCRLESIGDIMLDSSDDSTEHTFSITLNYDYFKIKYGSASEVPTLV